jgi:hypothetical protein
MRQQEDRPQDPNHENVINISSDDDFGSHVLDNFEDNDSAHGETSSYFQPSPAVRAFNAQCQF